MTYTLQQKYTISHCTLQRKIHYSIKVNDFNTLYTLVEVELYSVTSCEHQRMFKLLNLPLHTVVIDCPYGLKRQVIRWLTKCHTGPYDGVTSTILGFSPSFSRIYMIFLNLWLRSREAQFEYFSILSTVHPHYTQSFYYSA